MVDSFKRKLNQCFGVFDNEPNTIYSTYDWSISSDGKFIFLEFNNPDGSGKLHY